MRCITSPSIHVFVSPFRRRIPLRSLALLVDCEALSDDASAAAKLVKWISESGFISDKIHLEGRQIKTVTAIPSHTLIASIPKSLLIRTDEVTDPSMDSIFSQLPVGSSSGGEAGAWAYRLALVILWLYRQKCHLAHIELLPARAHGTLAPRIGFALDGDVVSEEAQYLPLIEAVLNQQFFVEDFYNSVLSSLRPSHPMYPISKEEFTWALAVASSRSFRVSAGGPPMHVMPPFIDMIDHDLAANVEVKIEEDGTFNLFTAAQAIAPGQLLRLSYGHLDNVNLILSFGFMMPDNPADKFEFDFNVESIGFLDPEISLPPSPWKIELLTRVGLISSNSLAPVKKVFFRAPSIHDPNPVDPRLLAAIKILRSPDLDENQHDLDNQVSRFSDSYDVGNLGSWPPPFESRQILSSLALALYKGMGTTLQQDVTERNQLQLADKSLMLDFRIAIKRALEKALLAIRSVK